MGEFIIETSRELGRCHSRLEIASSKLGKRSEALFETCSTMLSKGQKERATVYANEIAEIRRVISIMQHTELTVERTILRLDTLQMVSPSLESIEDTFCDVKKALGLVSTIMPSITPEMSRLNEAVNEILDGTQLNLTNNAPIIENNPTTEAILCEAANIVEQKMQSRIPEPPIKTKIPQYSKHDRRLVAIATNGSEIYSRSDESPPNYNENIGSFDVSLFLLEELVMDYIERNMGDMNVTRCAGELNLPTSKIREALNILSRNGRISILK